MLQKLREAELEAETEHQRRLKVSRLTTNRQLPGSLGFAQLSLGLRRWRAGRGGDCTRDCGSGDTVQAAAGR